MHLGVKWKNRYTLNPFDWIFMFLFWLLFISQIIGAVIMYTSVNTQSKILKINFRMDRSSNAICSGDFLDPSSGVCGVIPKGISSTFCVSTELCDKMKQCRDKWSPSLNTPTTRSLPTTMGIGQPDSNKKGPGVKRSFLSSKVIGDVEMETTQTSPWEFFEMFPKIPGVLIPGSILVCIVWLGLVEFCTKFIIWLSIAASISGLIGYWLFLFFDSNQNHWPLLLVACLIFFVSIIFCGVINSAVTALQLAGRCLRQSPGISIVSSFVQLVYLVYMVGWLVGITESNLIRIVDTSTSECHLVSPKILNYFRIFLGLSMWVMYYAFLGIKTVICAVGAGEWYFTKECIHTKGQRVPVRFPAIRGLSIALTTSAGGIMFCSLVVGFTRYLIERIQTSLNNVPLVGRIASFFLSCCSKFITWILEFFSRFSLISQAISGDSFCYAAGRAAKIVMKQFGAPLLVDGIAHTVLQFGAKILSLGIGFAAWAWTDHLTGDGTLVSMSYWSILVLIGYFIAIESPLISIIGVIIFSEYNASLICGSYSQCSGQQKQFLNNSSVITFSLVIASLSHLVFYFFADIILCTADTMVYCQAIEKDRDPEEGVGSRLAESVPLKADES